MSKLRITYNAPVVLTFALVSALVQFLPAGDKHLAYTKLTEPFFLYMKVAFFAGLFVASPVIILQLWHFISPGLYKRERRYAAPFIFFATLFFLIGGWFGYQILLPRTCQFFVNTVHNAYLDWFTPGPSKHPVFGKITSGMDVVKKIETTPTAAGDRPKTPVKMNKVTIQGM